MLFLYQIHSQFFMSCALSRSRCADQVLTSILLAWKHLISKQLVHKVDKFTHDIAGIQTFHVSNFILYLKLNAACATSTELLQLQPTQEQVIETLEILLIATLITPHQLALGLKFTVLQNGKVVELRTPPLLIKFLQSYQQCKSKFI